MPEKQSSEIRNIIFDLGGVLLNINPLLSLNELVKISGFSQPEIKQRLTNSGIFEKFDTGNLSPDQFRNELCTVMGKKISNTEIDRVWNLLLLDFPQARVQMLQQLQKNYRIFLLSNTNIIHFEKYTSDFYETYGIEMGSLFDRMFLSFEIGIHKPDAGIYTHLLQQGGIRPDESLFFDDLLPNIEAAAALGIAGIQVKDAMDVTSCFENGILKVMV